jgi:cell division protein FtsI (penicillin-binding protein 3)
MAGAAFAVAGASQVKVQVLEGSSIVDRARDSGKFEREIVDRARRGSLLSADGKPLAKDEELYEFGIDFRRVPHTDAFFVDLARASGIPASEFRRFALSGIRRQDWREPVGRDRARAIRSVQSEWRADGVSLLSVGTRIYPLGEMAAGITGMVREGDPLNGLEKSLHASLTGSDGKTVGLLDRTGAFLPTRIVGQTIARSDGQTVVLTIDSVLQQAAATAIRDAVLKHQADRGAALVLDPNTGDVLAMANYPSFEPNVVASSPVQRDISDFNPTYMSRLEPGSTFKILTLAKAIDSGQASMSEVFHCTGSLTVGRRQVRCAAHGGSRAHGAVDPVKSIAVSCNTNASAWARRVGHAEFVRYIEELGLVETTRLGLPGEQRGEFNYREPAKDLQLANLGFGQSITSTPLGLARAFSAIANGGYRVEPRLVVKVGDREVPQAEPQRVLKPETARQVLLCMEAVVQTDQGTGKSLRIPGYRLAGKTGTAQKRNEETGKIGGGGYVSNFVGFVPADEPKALILVMVDRPKAGGYYGGTVAGPVFLSLARAVISRYQIPPGEPVVNLTNDRP